MNMPIPEAIKNAPELQLGLQLFYLGFLNLASSRYTDGGFIPWAAVRGYCKELELDAETTMDMHHHVLQMDVARQDHFEKKRGKDNGNSKGLRPPNTPKR